MNALTALIVALVLPLVPGARNPDVTQATISTTICVVGWAATIRPPSSYTSAIKRIQLGNAKLADKNPRRYEEDHLIPLSLGGDPWSPRNLWPEPWPQARRSDQIERYLHRAVCDHDLSLRNARRIIVEFKRRYG